MQKMMRNLFYLFSITLFTVTNISPAISQTQNSLDTKTYILGKVISAKDNNGISGVKIYLKNSNRTIFSDINGDFLIELLYDKEEVEFIKDGYISKKCDLTISTPQIVLIPLPNLSPNKISFSYGMNFLNESLSSDPEIKINSNFNHMFKLGLEYNINDFLINGSYDFSFYNPIISSKEKSFLRIDQYGYLSGLYIFKFVEENSHLGIGPVFNFDVLSRPNISEQSNYFTTLTDYFDSTQQRFGFGIDTRLYWRIFNIPLDFVIKASYYPIYYFTKEVKTKFPDKMQHLNITGGFEYKFLQSNFMLNLMYSDRMWFGYNPLNYFQRYIGVNLGIGYYW